MGYKLKTSKRSEEIVTWLETSQKIPCFVSVKLAISLSIKTGKLNVEDFKTDALGRELTRPTITGDGEILFKCLMELVQNQHLSDEEFFPKYVKAHIDRGMKILESEARYSKDLFLHLAENLDKSL